MTTSSAESGLIDSFLGVIMPFITKQWTTLVNSDNFHFEEIGDFPRYLSGSVYLNCNN